VATSIKNGTDSNMKCLPPEVFSYNEKGLASLLSLLSYRLGVVMSEDLTINQKISDLTVASMPVLFNRELNPTRLCVELRVDNKTLAQQIQHLFLRFGVLLQLTEQQNHKNVESVFNTAQEITVGKHFSLRLINAHQLNRFVEKIGFSNANATGDMLDQILTEQPASHASVTQALICKSIDLHECLPDNIQGYIDACTPQTHLDSDSYIKPQCTKKEVFNYLQNHQDDYLSSVLENDIYWDEIVSIEYQGYKQVYDLTVPDVHNFIAQDICVHNTTFAMNLVENALMLEEKPVLVFSLEMPAEQIMMRMLASLSRVDQTAIRTAKLEDTDWAKIQSSVKMLSEKDNLFIDDSSGLTPMEVRTRARKLARDRGGISMIMVDYLQLMRVPSLSENRTLEISEISRSLKALAKELECPVIALSQLNRGLEQRADKRPINSDLRESGAIEQDADLIMFIYRDEVYNESSELQGIAEIIIGKQRNGPIGTTRLTFQGRFSRFENYAGPAYDDE
jgi:replicative DNA helicase